MVDTEAFWGEEIGRAIFRLAHVFGLEADILGEEGKLPKIELDDIQPPPRQANTIYVPELGVIKIGHFIRPNYELGSVVGHYLHHQANPEFYDEIHGLDKSVENGKPSTIEQASDIGKIYNLYNHVIDFVKHYAGLTFNEEGHIPSRLSGDIKKELNKVRKGSVGELALKSQMGMPSRFKEAAEYFKEHFGERKFTNVVPKEVNEAIRYISLLTDMDLSRNKKS